MQAIGHILPFAVAVALSSVPIMATMFILLSPNRSRSALPFLIGWVLGIFLVVALCALVAQVVPTARLPRQPDTAVGGSEILVGVALIGLALLTLRHARRQTTHDVPKWLKASANFGPWKSFGLAFVLNLRPKALLLAIAAGLTIRADADSLTDALWAMGIYTVIAASTVGVPIIATLASPARMEPRLVSMREWLIQNGEALGSVIGIVIGVVIVGMGLARL
jgi:Sap, sulfolipid-1-addressing protein